MKTVLILDLDNTIYPVKSIGDKLFAPLFSLIDEHKKDISPENYTAAREEIMQRPFQKVAEKYGFSRELTEKGVDLLRNTTYEEPMKPFDDYAFVKDIKADKFLVTTGFKKLQESKIKRLRIESDFKEIFISDPDTSDKTKKEIFSEIIERYGYEKKGILVIGDDPASEIEAAASLGIETFLYDPQNQYPNETATYKSVGFKVLKKIVEMETGPNN